MAVSPGRRAASAHVAAYSRRRTLVRRMSGANWRPAAATRMRGNGPFSAASGAAEARVGRAARDRL